MNDYFSMLEYVHVRGEMNSTGLRFPTGEKTNSVHAFIFVCISKGPNILMDIKGS